MTRYDFGTTSEGNKASLYILTNKNGMKAAVTDYGAALVHLKMYDKQGIYRDLVLGYDDVSGYELGTESFGGTVGRFANRIGRGRFMLNGNTYQLSLNNGPNTLHGGRDFYVKRLWDVSGTEMKQSQAITFCLKSPDKDQGFPGNVTIAVTYSLTDDNELHIDYQAESDADTPLNLTNHSYFNLGGHDSGSVLSQYVQLYADQITEPDENSLPTGRFLNVKGTPMDFTSAKPLGQDIFKEDELLKIGNGYDHNFVIKGSGYRDAGSLYCPETGIKMLVKTDLPGIQMYTANYVNQVKGKNGAVYQARDAVCFESQYYPDAINKENFPGGILKAGEVFRSRTSYCFSLE